MKSQSITDFLASSLPLIDVRSPGEFSVGHIPGAVNIPLFDDEERAIVGTTYKQESQEAAIRIGLKIAGENMAKYMEAIDALNAEAVRLHCWRGGMRSESMAWLFDKLVSQTYVLEGGYKSYRQAVHNYFEKPLNLAILTGNTGSGKTRILHELKEQGQQVIDLEGLANHQGSSFGYQKSTGQPTTEQFQNNLFEAFSRLDPTKPIWLEDESFCIGHACMPEELFQQMQESPRYLVNVPLDRRLENILEDYSRIGPKKLIAATRGITKKLGKTQAELAETLINEGSLKEAAAILLAYYDKRYSKSLDKYREKIVATLEMENESDGEISARLIEAVTAPPPLRACQPEP